MLPRRVRMVATLLACAVILGFMTIGARAGDPPVPELPPTGVNPVTKKLDYSLAPAWIPVGDASGVVGYMRKEHVYPGPDAAIPNPTPVFEEIGGSHLVGCLYEESGFQPDTPEDECIAGP